MCLMDYKIFVPAEENAEAELDKAVMTALDKDTQGILTLSLLLKSAIPWFTI